MKFTISRESLLFPLGLVVGVVERRQTLPILSNVLMVLEDERLSFTGTDLEVELIGRTIVSGAKGSLEVTVPARKLLDICKSLPEDSEIEILVEESKVKLHSGRSRFTLSSLPASDFPSIEDSIGTSALVLKQPLLRRLIDRAGFAMAQQDVRYYLNGMLLEVSKGQLRAVATDGHRLAMCSLAIETGDQRSTQVIVPRKGVLELSRLLDAEGDEEVSTVIGTNHIRVTSDKFTFTSKLVDGKFPDYERVLPKSTTNELVGSRLDLRQAFLRTSILSNEKYRGVRVKLSQNLIEISANNPEQEEAEEALTVDYSGAPIEMGFNVSYLLDVLAVLEGDKARISLSDPNSSALIEESDGGDSLYVVMPMRL